MSEDEALLQAFQGSQRKKARIAVIVVALAIAGFIGLKLYQGYLRADSTARMEALQQGRILER
jgi:hypothetical protein